jgi:hypothetical protein
MGNASNEYKDVKRSRLRTLARRSEAGLDSNLCNLADMPAWEVVRAC